MLERTGKILKFASDLEEIMKDPTNFSTSLESFRRTRMYQERKYTEQTLPGILGEHIVRAAIDGLLVHDLFLERASIPHRKTTKHFLFERREDNRVVTIKKPYHPEDPRDYSEIDALVKVNGIPVLIEVKLLKEYYARRHNVAERGMRDNGKKARGVCSSLHLDHVKAVTMPIVELFGQDCGYIVVTYPEHVRMDSPAQRKFTNNGGILVPFYTDRASYLGTIGNRREFAEKRL